MYLEPERFIQTKEDIDSDPRIKKEFVDVVVNDLNDILLRNGIDGSISIKLNGYYELSKKRENSLINGKTSVQRGYMDINDLISFRVILDKKDLIVIPALD